MTGKESRLERRLKDKLFRIGAHVLADRQDMSAVLLDKGRVCAV
jgi:hypothetical protein